MSAMKNSIFDFIYLNRDDHSMLNYYSFIIGSDVEKNKKVLKSIEI